MHSLEEVVEILYVHRLSDMVIARYTYISILTCLLDPS